MTISIVQSATGAFPQGTTGPYKALVTLNNVTAGNTIMVATFGRTSVSTTPTCTDQDGTTYTDLITAIEYQAGSQYLFADIAANYGVAAGTHNIVCTIGGGPSSAYGFSTAIEISGLATAPLDKVASGNGNGVATTGTTAPVVGGNEIAISVFGYLSSGSGAIVDSNGYTAIYTQASGSVAGIKGQVNYLTPLPSGVGASDAWTASSYFAGAIAVLKGSTSSGSTTAGLHSLSLLGVGR